MRRQIAYSLIADGGTDRALVPIIEWAIHELDPEVEILEPDFRKRNGQLHSFLDAYETGSSLIFAHRDSENETLEVRLREFDAVARANVVAVVPVKMTESWLLIDAAAIAAAAGEPDAIVVLPPASDLESISDPKSHLEDLLYRAAGPLTGRRRKKFQASITNRRVEVAQLTCDFAPLQALPSFRHFQERLANAYPFGPSR